MPLFFTIIPRVTNGASVVKLLSSLPLGLLRCVRVCTRRGALCQDTIQRGAEGRYVLDRVAFFPPR